MQTAMIAFGVAGVISAIFVLLVKQLALKMNIVDVPDGGRKLHKGPKPLLGGVAIFLSFALVYGWARLMRPEWFAEIPDAVMVSVLVAGAVIMIGGFLDDKFNLPAWQQIVFTLLAAMIAVFGGLSVHEITNPLGGIVMIPAMLAPVVAFMWIFGMMYTTKLLDGLDGLATGVVLIGALMIFALTQTDSFFQPDVGLLTMIFAGALVGFLVFNVHPAKIFLGEGGSVFIGFMLAVLAIISGSKIATTLLVIGIPVLDVVWVIIARFRKKKTLTRGGREHLHHRFLDKGFSHWQTVLTIWVLALAFGASAIWLASWQKVVALLALVFVMIGLGWYLVWDSSALTQQKKNQ